MENVSYLVVHISQATKNEEEPDLIEWGAAGGEDETDAAANKGSSSGGKVNRKLLTYLLKILNIFKYR